jgi:hypothetical protein
MTRDEAICLLREALTRIEHPQENANGGPEQTGGAYWRLAKVISEYLAPNLQANEGEEHASHLQKQHSIMTLNPIDPVAFDDFLRSGGADKIVAALPPPHEWIDKEKFAKDLMEAGNRAIERRNKLDLEAREAERARCLTAIAAARHTNTGHKDHETYDDGFTDACNACEWAVKGEA